MWTFWDIWIIISGHLTLFNAHHFDSSANKVKICTDALTNIFGYAFVKEKLYWLHTESLMTTFGNKIILQDGPFKGLNVTEILESLVTV